MGNWLNGKLVLYLGYLCLTEKSRIFNPQPRQAPERYFFIVFYLFFKEEVKFLLFYLVVLNKFVIFVE